MDTPKKATILVVDDGGTLFLDEVGNINPQMQAKLLGVLESRTLTRVGSDRAIPVDVRLVCATNMPLYEMVEDGRFRQDLLYRINTVELQPVDFVLTRRGAAPTAATPPPSLKLEDMERETIRRALDKHAGNLSRAAAELGLSRATLYRKMEKYGL